LPRKTASVSIQNVVASASLKQTLNLNSIVRAFPSVEYRAEQFPGLVYRLNKPKTGTLIFSSGARSESQVHEAVKNLQGNLEEKKLVSYE